MRNYPKGEPIKQRQTTLLKLQNLLRYQVGTNAPTLTMELLENRQLTVDGATGIIEYCDDVVRISSKKHIVTVVGAELVMSAFTTRSIVVRGIITDVKLS